MPRKSQTQASYVAQTEKPLTPAQKSAITRARNRQAQELADRMVANEIRPPRSSKVKGRENVKAWTQASKRAPEKRAHSDSESEEGDAPLAKKFREYNSQPSIPTQMPQSPPLQKNTYSSEDEDNTPMEQHSRNRKSPKGTYDANTFKQIARPQDAEEEDDEEVAEEEDERRSMEEIDQGSDGDGEEVDDGEDLARLMDRPDVLKAKLQHEMPRIVNQVDASLEDEQHNRPKRKRVPRHLLEDDTDFEDDGEVHEQPVQTVQDVLKNNADNANNADEDDADDDEEAEDRDIPDARAKSSGRREDPPQASTALVRVPQQGRRAQARIAERPKPQEDTRDVHAHLRSTSRARVLSLRPSPDATQEAIKWPLEIQLRHSKKGKVNLTQQNGCIQSLAHAAIEAFYVDLVFRTTLPNAMQKFLCYQDILQSCARQLQHETGDPIFKVIRRRIRQDVEYAKDLIALANERVYIKRGDAKKVARAYVETEYGLHAGEHRRFGMLADQFSYIFPSVNGDIQWLQPFMRPIFAKVIFDLFFKGPDCFASRYASRFPSPNGRREIPQGMVCLAAVAIYMTLNDIAYDGSHVSVQAKAANWDSEYAAIWRFIDGLKARGPRGFSDLMAELYESASNGQVLQSRVQVVDDVLAKIDFDKLGAR
ncbi:hypothetical protein K474DRAFT_1713972 [Panus rudis PR-1116 ss-1]|nr:hypothetical protein K474DRAFT_1713972 [Panus rudis PR-1116 ss-1]